MAIFDQDITAMGPNPFEDLNATLTRVVSRIHNGRDGHGRSLNADEFREIHAGFKAACAGPFRSVLHTNLSTNEKGQPSQD